MFMRKPVAQMWKAHMAPTWVNVGFSPLSSYWEILYTLGSIDQGGIPRTNDK